MSRKKYPNPDPHAAREAQKYPRPIASRELILHYLNDSPGPRNNAQIARDLGIESPEEITALRRRLKAMERDGQVICNRRGSYGPVAKMDLIRGRVIGHPDGYGFLVPDDGSPDLFLSGRQMRTLLHGVSRLGGSSRSWAITWPPAWRSISLSAPMNCPRSGPSPCSKRSSECILRSPRKTNAGAWICVIYP